MVSSIYIHIPFCQNICSYCNFTKMYYNHDLVLKYLDSLEEEIKLKYCFESINTLYIGGGTPSSLSLLELEKLFNILSVIMLNNSYEFTIEVNVSDINEDKLKLFKKYGVNRLSIGIQTFNEKYIKFLERNHSKDEVLEKVNLAKKYFSNISIDLMYGFFNQTIDEVNKDLELVLSINPQHISIYSLILEKNTKLYINKIKSLDEEIESNMYYNIIRVLEDNGYNHYETSNFSKKGYESKHNLVYWNNEHYYGFGLSASSYLLNERSTNTKNLTKYLKKEYSDEKEILSIEDIIEYEMILGLRKIKGIDITEFKNKYHQDINEIFDIDKMLKEKKLILKDNHLYINKRYLYLSNQILVEFIRG